MSDEPTVYTRTADKPRHWHSRRYESDGPHVEARETYQASSGRRARQLRALERLRGQLGRYIAAKLNGAKKAKRGKRKYVPDDLDQATDRVREEIATLELRLGIKTKIEVEPEDGEALEAKS